MLRTIDVPTRNVTGFVGGTYNRFGNFYAVRQGDAHSWVEVYVQGRGWMTFDPTPPSGARPHSEIEGALASVRDFFEAVSQQWDHRVLGYDLEQQVNLFDAMSHRTGGISSFRRPTMRTLLLLAGIFLALGSWWYLRRRRKKGTESDNREGRKKSREEALATGLYQALDRAMTAMGVARPTTMPPLRHALGLVEGAHEHGEEILALTERYLAARFGHDPLTSAERRDFEQRIRAMLERHKHQRRGDEPRSLEDSGEHLVVR